MRLAGASGLERELARDEEQDEDGEDGSEESGGDPSDSFDVELIGPNGRRGWLREAHRQLEQARWMAAGPIPRSRAERLRLGARFLEDELAAECRGTCQVRRSAQPRRARARHQGAHAARSREDRFV